MLLTLALTASAAELVSERVAVGVHTDGSLVDDDAVLGVLFDPDGPAGPTPLGSDLLLPGRPFETWAASWDGGSVVAGGPYLSGGPTLDWERHETLAFDGLTGSATLGALTVQIAVDLALDREVLWLEVTLTALEPVVGLRVSRSVDFDIDATFDAYETDNALSGGLVSSASTHAEKAVALGVRDGQAAICGDWCSTPAAILAATGSAGVDDAVVGAVVEAGDLEAGASFTARFVYAFAPDAATALALAAEALEDEDRDLDGAGGDDCDDRDPLVGPGFGELWDGIDNDCDGVVDEETAGYDDDGDGASEVDGDCDDADPAVGPDAGCEDAIWPEDRELSGEEPAERSGGCSTVPLDAPLLLLLLPLVRRRR